MTDPFAAARPHLRHNFVVHTIDAGFFGLGLGFASFVTLMPLFIATLTDLPMAIGLIAVVHPMGWTLPLAMTLEFGTAADRPVYIGLANTLTAPSIALAPLFGGWLAQVAGYEALFGAAAVAGLGTALLLRGQG